MQVPHRSGLRAEPLGRARRRSPGVTVLGRGWEGGGSGGSAGSQSAPRRARNSVSRQNAIAHKSVQRAHRPGGPAWRRGRGVRDGGRPPAGGWFRRQDRTSLHAGAAGRPAAEERRGQPPPGRSAAGSVNSGQDVSASVVNGGRRPE